MDLITKADDDGLNVSIEQLLPVASRVALRHVFLLRDSLHAVIAGRDNEKRAANELYKALENCRADLAAAIAEIDNCKAVKENIVRLDEMYRAVLEDLEVKREHERQCIENIATLRAVIAERDALKAEGIVALCTCVNSDDPAPDCPCCICIVRRSNSDLAAANAAKEEAERKLCAARELLAVIYKEPQPWSGYKVDGQSYSIYAEIKAILSSSSPCRHEEEAKQLKEDIVELHRFAETHAEVEREDSKLIAKWAGEATSLRKAVNDEQGIEKLIKDNFHTKWDNPHVPPERHVYRAIRDYVFRKTSP